MEQKIITARDNYIELDRWVQENKAKRILLVCGDSIRHQKAFIAHIEEMKKLGVQMIEFRDFQPNPRYESVVEGVKRFHREKCKAIVAVGGGSAMDVAKCIKLYSNMDDARNYLEQEIVPNDIPFLAMPTTAGTGSEATRYAVIYYEGKKQSVTSASCIPGTVLLDPNCLKTLPLYQKKCTMLDALCHAIEAFWSVNSTDASKEYSRAAIRGVLDNLEGYISNTNAGNAGMLVAANMAGKAINITQTTAAHAMSYKITSMYGLPHGHAVAVCMPEVWGYMLEHVEECIDDRGAAYFRNALAEIAEMIDLASFKAMLEKLEMARPVAENKDAELEALAQSVNPVRLKNNPVALSTDVLKGMYGRIVRG